MGSVFFFNLFDNPRKWAFLVPLLQMKRLKSREVKRLA